MFGYIVMNKPEIKMKDFLQQTETQLEQMGRNGRKLVEEKYSSQKMAYDMVNLYRKILEQ